MSTIRRVVSGVAFAALLGAACFTGVSPASADGRGRRQPHLYDEELLRLLATRWEEFRGDQDARAAISDMFLSALMSDTTSTLSFFRRNPRVFAEWVAGLGSLSFFPERACSCYLCSLDTFIEVLNYWYPEQHTEAREYSGELRRVVDELKAIRARSRK